MPRLEPDQDAIRLPTRYAAGVEYVPINGPAGPAGEPGAQGPAGAAGPAGTAGVDATRAPAYFATYFLGDDDAGTKGALAVSPSGRPATWTRIGAPQILPTEAPFYVRDINPFEYGGAIGVAFTKGTFTTAMDSFGLKRSGDDGETWANLPDVSLSGGAAAMGGQITRAWVDNVYTDDTGVPHVFVAVTTDPAGFSPFKRLETHPLNTALTSWSTPVLCSAGLPTTTLDYAVAKIGSTYHGLFKDNAAERIVKATAASYLGPWTVTSNDVTGMAQVEASNIVQLPDGTYLVTFDNYLHAPSSGTDQVADPNAAGWRFAHARSFYMTTPDLVTFTAPKELPELGRFPRLRRFSTAINLARLRDLSKPSVARVIATNSAVCLRASGDASPLTFDGPPVEDTDGMWSAARPSVLTVRVPGYYTPAAYALWSVTADGLSGGRFMQILINGVNLSGLTDKRYVPTKTSNPGAVGPGVALANDAHVSMTWPKVWLNRGDEVTYGPMQDSGAPLALLTSVPPMLSLTRDRD